MTSRVEVKGQVEGSAQAAILSDGALAFLGQLAAFTPRVKQLLSEREARQARLDAGTESLDFLASTRAIREAGWKVGAIPFDLRDRRVEITGPVDRKMVINALNSGARVFMADFEDSNAPTWSNCLQGQVNLFDAVRRSITFTAPETGKAYALVEKPAVLIVRPRGWHLPERHLTFGGEPLPGALVDFGLFFFHNARELLARGTGPYFYLPKLESHREARLWNDVFVTAQSLLGLPLGTIKSTVLIETLPAAFEMDEILFELREHIVGLNCGRWDYIFSFTKKLAADPARVLPDRGQVSMEQPFLRAYAQLLVKTCHRRGAFAMGGMAAFIPDKRDAEANATALARVKADKLREVKDGHDGTWVAHPGLVETAMAVFDAHLEGPNQLHVLRDDVKVAAADLLKLPEGTRTEAGLRQNVRVGVRYLESWLRGSGCVPLYGLMEDAATAEISRAQLWQWVRHSAATDDGKPITAARFQAVLAEEVGVLKQAGEAGARIDEAAQLFGELVVAPRFEAFLTTPAYARI